MSKKTCLKAVVSMNKVVKLIEEYRMLKRILDNCNGNRMEIVIKETPSALMLTVHIQENVQKEIEAVLLERKQLIKRKLNDLGILEEAD